MSQPRFHPGDERMRTGPDQTALSALPQPLVNSGKGQNKQIVNGDIFACIDFSGFDKISLGLELAF